jgi:acyl-coenzyme A thioesterase PaaI-like protein
MKASDIAYSNTTGIIQREEELSLEHKSGVLNHINTIHGAAQFTLAETKSGIYLQSLYPELKGLVLPLLREAKIKYKKTATTKITAHASINKQSQDKFDLMFPKKGRACIEVEVQIKDITGEITAIGSFQLFVSKL